MMLIMQSSYAVDSGTYAAETSVSSAYLLVNQSLPGSVTFPTKINDDNEHSTETIGPYSVSAFTNVPEVGLRLTLVNSNAKQHPPGSDQLYLVRNPTLPGTPDQYLRIPYKIEYRPCYNPEIDPDPPAPMDLHPDPTGDENIVTVHNAQNYACSDASGGVQGAMSFVREAMNYLPMAGTYEGTISIEVGPQ